MNTPRVSMSARLDDTGSRSTLVTHPCICTISLEMVHDYLYQCLGIYPRDGYYLTLAKLYPVTLGFHDEFARVSWHMYTIVMKVISYPPHALPYTVPPYALYP